MDVGNPVWGYVVTSLVAVREVCASVWEMTTKDGDGLEILLDDLLALMVVMHGVSERFAEHVRRGEGGLYSVVCARIFDFVVLVDHVVFYVKQEVQLRGTSAYSDSNNRTSYIFREDCGDVPSHGAGNRNYCRGQILD